MRPVAKLDKQKIPAQWVGKPTLFWDGDCGFCRRAIEWVKSEDKKGAVASSPFQACSDWLPPEVVKLSPIQVHFMDGEGVFWGGADAVVKTLEIIGFSFSAQVLASPLVSPLHGLAYRLVAKNRRLFSRFLFRGPQS